MVQDQLKLRELIQYTKDEIVTLILTELTPETVALVNQYKGQLGILELLLASCVDPFDFSQPITQ